MKQGIRILAVEDSRFVRGDKNVLIVGIVGRGELIEGVLSFRVEADGTDATQKIIKSALSSRFMDQIKLIATNGTTLAGMNIIDITEINRKLKLPVIAITRKKPHPSMLKRSIRLAKPKGEKEKLSTIDRISSAATMRKMGGFYVQTVGIKNEPIEQHVENAVKLLRLGHMIASGVSGGESRGRL